MKSKFVPSRARISILALFATIPIAVFQASSHAQKVPGLDPTKHQASAAFKWLDIVLEASAREVERIGASPTILSRQMAIPVTAMFDAWAAYDAKAVGTIHGGALRRPESERTAKNKETAIAYAAYRTAIDQFPHSRNYITEEMKRMGYEPE